MPALVVNTICVSASVALLAGAAATLSLSPAVIAVAGALLGGLGLVAAVAWRLAAHDGFRLPAPPATAAPASGLVEIPSPANDPAPGRRPLAGAATAMTRDLLLVDGVAPTLALPQIFVPGRRLAPMAVNEPLALLPA